MKKIIGKLAGTILAAAALFSVASCKNQLDYVNDTTAINRMKILGFHASGEALKSYNGATAALYVVENEVAKCIAKGEVAGTNSSNLNYLSGNAYVKLTTPYIFDGDKYHVSSIEMYLVVADKTLKVWNKDFTSKENASLSIPSSPAGTDDKDLEERFVTITVPSVDDDASVLYDFAKSNSVTEPTKSNLYEIYADKVGILGNKTIAEWNKIPGIKVETETSKTTNPKYTITISGLDNDIGGKYGVRGASISAKDSDLGDHWDQKNADEGLDSVIAKDDKGVASISFKFYGKKPTWASEDDVGPAFKIVKVGTEKDPWECLLGDSKNQNLFFPKDIGSNDVTVSIDYTKLATDAKKFTAATKEDSKYVKKFTINKVILKNAPAIGDAGYIALCESWLPGNIWGVKTSNKITSLTGKDAILALNYDYCIDASSSDSSVELKLQAVNPAEDNDGKFWKNIIYADSDPKASVSFSEYKDKNINLVYDITAKTAKVEVAN